MNACCRIAVVSYFLVGLVGGADEPSLVKIDEVGPACSQPAASGGVEDSPWRWEQAKPELRDGIAAQAKALGQSPDAFLERMFLRHLADTVTETYAAMTDLTVECQVYVSLKMIPPSDQPKIEFDDAAPLVATALWKMKPNQQFRVEVRDGDRFIWGKVSSDETKEPNKRSIAVQWTPTMQSKPYEEGLFNGEHWKGSGHEIRSDLLPGRCVLGMFWVSLIGGSECYRNSWFYSSFRPRVRDGIYEGMRRAADGSLCHSVRYDIGEEYFRYYIDPDKYYFRQTEDLGTMMAWETEKIVGVASHRFLFRHVSDDMLPESEFAAPDPGDRTLVDMAKLFPQ